MNWYFEAFKNYADFSGRARRTEYWMFILINIVFSIVALVMDIFLGLLVPRLDFGVFFLIYTIISFIPGLSLVIRRLHDTGKSGWTFLIVLIPIIGAIWLIVLLATDSNIGENDYGPNPKGIKIDNDLVSQSSGTSLIKEESSKDIIILLVVIWLLATRLFYAILPTLINNVFSNELFIAINSVLGFIWACIPLLLAFAIRKKSTQTILLVLGSINLLYALFELIRRFL